MAILSVKTPFTIALLWLYGCASTPGAQPQDMSKVGHEQTASEEERLAAVHAGTYNPNAAKAGEICDGEYCWPSVTNPTEAHRKDAERHRKMAADHRAASQAIRNAELQSCTGVSATDRDTSPFYHREDIVKVTSYTQKRITEEYASSPPGLEGAVVTFRAVPGMTPEWLQRIVKCHLARNASVGFDMPEMSDCPLAVKGAHATVASTGSGFSVAIGSDDSRAAQEIQRRAQALVRAGR